jgi:uncharacterized protein (UPF0333 family)
MKKTVAFFPLLLAGLVLLAGCAGTTNPAKTDFASYDGDAIDDNEARLIAASASDNLASVTNITIRSKASSDNTALYKDGLASQAAAITTDVEGNVTIFSNRLTKETIAYSTTKTDGIGGTASDYVNETDFSWVGNPIDANLTGVYSLFSEEKIADKDGNVFRDRFDVDSPSFSPVDSVEAAWGKKIADNFNSIYQYSTSQLFVKISDGSFVATRETTSQGSLSNPLFPSDATKTIGSYDISQETYYFVKKSAGVYQLTKASKVDKTLVATDFSFNVFSSPAVLESSVTVYTMNYDAKTIGSIPTYVDSQVEAPVLNYFTPTGNSAVFSGSDSIGDVTPSYKILNPTFSGFAYEETLSLSSSNYYAFSTETDSSAPLPTYDKWGYSAIDASSIKFGTITKAAINGKDYFAVADGTYSILVLLDSNENFSTIYVTYLGD